MVIDPVGTGPVFLAITTHLNKRQKIRIALDGKFVAGTVILFFAVCGVWLFALSEYFTYRISSCWLHHLAFGGA